MTVVAGSWRAMVFLVGLLVGGCGFEPVYGERTGGGGGAQDRLAEVNVLLMPERSGQLLRQALQSRLERGGAGAARRYDLSVQFAISGEPIGIQRDNSTSRLRLIGTANWSLYAQDAQRSTIASGTAREVDAFNIISQQIFAAELANSAVQRRMADAVADQIVLQLASHFARAAPR